MVELSRKMTGRSGFWPVEMRKKVWEWSGEAPWSVARIETFKTESEGRELIIESSPEVELI